MKVADTYLKGIRLKDRKFFISDGTSLLVKDIANSKKTFVFEYKSPATLKITRMALVKGMAMLRNFPQLYIIFEIANMKKRFKMDLIVSLG